MKLLRSWRPTVAGTIRRRLQSPKRQCLMQGSERLIRRCVPLPCSWRQTCGRSRRRPQNGIGSDGRPVITKVEDFGLKLAHQFPWAAAPAPSRWAWRCSRRFLSDPDAPSTVTRRLQVAHFLIFVGSGINC